MKQIGNCLLVFLGVWLFFSCDIASPYVDAISVKIDSDETASNDTSPDEETPVNQNPVTTGVAAVTNFTATVQSYDSAADSGVIRLTWDAPVATSDQTAAARIVIREYEAADPSGITSGTEVYDGAATATQADCTGVTLAESPHFGIWTLDAEGNVSTAQYRKAAIRLSSLSVMYDGYVDHYALYGNYSKYFDVNYLLLGNESSDHYYNIYLKFNPVTADNVLQALLSVYFGSGGSGFSFDLARFTSSWNNNTIDSDLENCTFTDIGTYIVNSGGYNTWDVTSTVSDWINNTSEDYGFKLYDTYTSGYYTAYFQSNEASSNKPQLNIYYASYD